MKQISDHAGLLIGDFQRAAKTYHENDYLSRYELELYAYAQNELEVYIASLEAENRALRHALELRECEEKQRWIPVSESLPDNWKSVLTIDISKSTRDMVTAFYNPETSLWSTHFSCDLWVTHWMPLPEPPIVYGKVCEE